MSNQEIFNKLADEEERLFYKFCAERTPEAEQAHLKAQKELIDFAERTGCHN